MKYGAPPEAIQLFELECPEYMHYLYLPIILPGGSLRLPKRLEWARPMIGAALCVEAGFDAEALAQQHVYVTARHGYATPGNPLNRPGWHADGFGSQDINYIWSDRWPTRFAVGEFVNISDDHVLSAQQFDEQVERAESLAEFRVTRPGLPEPKLRIVEGREFMLYRLDSSMIHSVPIIPPPGGERTFLKISFSPDKYNLAGNSHNYLLDYDWKMWKREEVRNHPAYAGGDSGPQEV